MIIAQITDFHVRPRGKLAYGVVDTNAMLAAAVATIEAMPRDLDVDFVAIDEIQLASSLDRGHVFTDRILNRRAPAALERDHVWQVKKPLDAEAMHEAAKALIGHHDFTTFRDMACQARSPPRAVTASLPPM